MQRPVVFLVAFVVSSIGALACTTVEERSGDGGATSSGGTSGGTSSGDPPGPPAQGSSSGDPDEDPASTATATVDADGTCPTFTACGGALEGTYDYTAGCVTDVFGSLRDACPDVDTTKANVAVVGSLYFKGANLQRRATVTVSGSLGVPQSCASAAGGCAGVEALLKDEFDAVTCTGSNACSCTISRTSTANNGTTVTVSGALVTTGDGETYEICAKGTTLEYSGRSAGSEEGVWSLAKR